MMNPVSVKDRLKNQAKSSGRTMQDELVTYGLERTIYRLSVSDYAERFTLKGGIFLYALFDLFQSAQTSAPHSSSVRRSSSPRSHAS